MQTENLHIGTVEEIVEMVTKGHKPLEGLSLEDQIDAIRQRDNKMGLAMMRTSSGRFKIDKWYVHFYEKT